MDDKTAESIQGLLATLRLATDSVCAALIFVQEGQTHVFSCIAPGGIMTPEGIKGVGEAAASAVKNVSDQNAKIFIEAAKVSGKGAVS